MAGIKDKSGNFSVTAVIVILSCALFFYLVNAFTPLLDYKRQVVASNIRTNLALSMENLKTTLNNAEALKAIVNLPENAALKCVSQSTCTYDMDPQTLKVVSLDGIPISNGNAIGIDTNGQPCDATLGETKCIFIITVKWRPLCPADGSACINPPVEITSSTSFANSLAKFILNFNKIDFKIRLSNVAALIL